MKISFSNWSVKLKINFKNPCVIGMIICLGCMPAIAQAKKHSQHTTYPKSETSFSSLDIFVQQALEANPAMQAADANVDAALARQRASSQPLYNPALTAEGQKSVDSYYTVGVNQTIDIANKRDAREQIGSANLQVAEAQRSVIRQQLIAEVLNALARYQAAQQIVTLAKERTSLLQQFASLTEKRHTNGDVARVDVDLAQLALSEGYAQQADAEVNLSQALQILRATTGLKRTTWPRLPSQLPNLNLMHVNTADLINRLPILKVVNDQYSSAKARIRLAERERYPDPTIGIQGGKENTEGKSSGLVNVSVSIPLFVRNPYRAEVDAAHYDAIEAGQKRMNIMRQTRAEIEGSMERYQTLYQSVQQWQKISGKPLSDGMALIERLWQAGEINATDYLVQLKQRIDSQIAGEALKGRAWQAWVDWLKASGTIGSWVQNGQTTRIINETN